jgi:hypothetical protein
VLVTAEEIQVVVGTITFDEGGQLYDVERIISHPFYVVLRPPIYTSNWHE